MTKSQLAMLEDGAAACLFIDMEARRAAWERNPPKSAHAKFHDPRLEASLRMREEEKKIKTAARIKKLLNSKNKPERIDTTGMRWNTRFCRWEPQEEWNMSSKLVINAYDKKGKSITRCKGAISASATTEQIAERVRAVFARGKTVLSVSLTKPSGEAAGAWELQNGVPIQNDGAYKAPAQPEVTTTAPADASNAKTVEPEESAMRKTSKARKANGNGNGNGRHKATNGVRAGSKLEIIANLLKRKSGCTEREAAEAVGWARVSMSMRARDAGLKLKTEKGTDGVTRYYGA